MGQNNIAVLQGSPSHRPAMLRRALERPGEAFERTREIREVAMKHRWIVVSVALATALAMLPAAAEEPLVIERSARAIDRIPVDLSNAPGPGADGLVDVFVHLEGQSVAELMASSKAQGKNLTKAQKDGQAKALEREQANFARQLDRIGAKLNWSMQWAANGVAISARARDLLEIQGLPGVKTVGGIAKHYPSHEGSVPWIVSPEVQAAVSNGEGVKIGIIDTGIDYLHANLGGAGDPEDFAANDPEVIEDGTFPTAKVVGGYDFVGDAYDASSDDPAVNTPVPDNDPLDCNGHGSHVAGTAAGLGVDGLIGAGVAPAADLYALKVFGCDGSTAVTAQAIEWAVQNDLDVINMSLGSDFGSPDDPSVVASNNAAAAGVIVVASAGNDGDVPYVTGSPGVASAAISVAASYDGGYGDGAIEVTESPDESIVGLHPATEGAIGPPLSVVGPVDGVIAVALDDGSTGDPTFACGPVVTDVEGKFALIQRGVCSFGEKIANAEAAGAIGTIVYNDAARGDALLVMGFATSDHPSVFIGNTAGTAISAAASSGDVAVTLDAALEILDPTVADNIVDFSSSGPGGGNTYKPEISAPGVRIKSTAVGTGDKFANFNGTSMAAPHIAGVAALLRAQHPNAEVDTIKSLIMNSAIPAADGSPIVRQGNGVVRSDAAAALQAYTSPAGVSFGRINPVTAASLKQTITVHDMSGSDRVFAITAVLQDAPAGVAVTAPVSVEVQANGSASFDVELTLDPAAMDFDDGFYSQTNAAGIVTLSDDTDSLRVGFVAAVDPASNLSVASAGKNGREDSLLIVNDSATVGWADSFTYTGTGVGAVAAVGVRTDTLTSNVVEFGIAQSAPWESLSIRETDIFLDTNEDGSPEYVLVAADLGYLQGGGAEGLVVTALFDLVNGGGFLEFFVLADQNDHVQTLLVDQTGQFGFLEPGDTTFDYTVVTYDLRTGVDGLNSGSVDLTKAQGHYSLGLGPASGGIVRPKPPNADTQLWLFQNNSVPDQFQVIKIAPDNKGGKSGNAPGKGGNEPPGQGGTPPGQGGDSAGGGTDAPGRSGDRGPGSGQPAVIGRERAAMMSVTID